ncbi:MAG: hypothetical protein H7062_08355 [Candidatus Saccharimonas sp.]|nr:hypothetical protein [Planctomycetaceae bacterium]
MLNIEMLEIWCVPFLQIIALVVLKGGWRLASCLGMIVWGLGWFAVYFINNTSLLAIIYYVVLMVVFACTRGAGGGKPA